MNQKPVENSGFPKIVDTTHKLPEAPGQHGINELVLSIEKS
jgi:hypothetical protein